MDLPALHVAAACLALVLGAAVLVGRKGGGWHVAAGRLYLGALLLVNLPVLFVYEATGGPGIFHVLAVVSLATTGAGWFSIRRRRNRRGGVGSHAAFMTWSWIGVVSAGLAQAANRLWPEQSPWPVIVVVGLATVLGLVLVPRYVARQLATLRTVRPLPIADPERPTGRFLTSCR